jgi:phage-related protein
MQKFKGAAGAMTKQSETLNGLFSTFTDTIKIKLTQAFQGLIPVAKTTLRVAALGPVVTAFAQALAPVLPVIVTVLGQVAAALQPVVSALAGAFTSALRTIAPILPTLARTFGQTRGRADADAGPVHPCGERPGRGVRAGAADHRHRAA